MVEWRSYKSNIIIIGLALVLGLLWPLLSHASGFIEQVYSRKLYLAFRGIFNVLSKIPIQLYIVVLAIFLISVVRIFWRKKSTTTSKFLDVTIRLVSLLATFYFFFQLLWGFNYSRKSPLDALQLTPVDNSEQFEDILKSEIKQLNALKAKALKDSIFTQEQYEIVKKAVVQTFLHLQMPVLKGGEVKSFGPEGFLFRLGTAGFYLPWAGEAYYEPALLESTKPFVVAHELGHAHGIGDEGHCDFLAYIACSESSHPALHYAAQFQLCLYLLSDAQRRGYKDSFDLLSKEVQRDFLKRSKVRSKYPDLFPKMRDFLYDQYLKKQGVSAGIQSYPQMVQWIFAYRQKEGHNLYYKLQNIGEEKDN